MEEVVEVITGRPQDIASKMGNPKLSRREGYKNTVAELYIKGINECGM
ncbi:MAG: hypothetical protein NVS1B13_10410 [Flavisolibacter sp.]